MRREKKALLQEDGRCLVCERQCVIKNGKRGYCQTRINENGVIYTLNYGNISSISINPIEKKPLFHFYPGTRALTVGFWSCNFNCPWCQNHDISKKAPQCNENLNPDDFVKYALTNSCKGISLSFNEPTIFLEWEIEVCKIARKMNLYNTMVTNGYMTENALELFLNAGIDAANVDIKGDKKMVHKYCGVDIDRVWRNCNITKKRNIHLEITTLIIPTVNDNLKILSDIEKRILDELGDATPWHLTRYFPAYKFSEPPTPITFLEDAYSMAKELGLKFVYLGNILEHKLEHKYENTYCPKCGKLLIKREGLIIIDMGINKNLVCPDCGNDLKNYFIV